MSSVPAVQEFEVGREFVLESCVNVPEGLVGRTRGESPSDDSSGILHATDPPPSEPQTDSPLPSLLLSTPKAESVPSPSTRAPSTRAHARASGTTVKIRPICNSSLILKFPFTPRIYFTTQSDCEVSSKTTVPARSPVLVRTRAAIRASYGVARGKIGYNP